VLIYVGGYTTPDRDGHAEGISAFAMDGDSGAWRPLGVVARVPNPSFLALDPSCRRVYCVHGAGFSEVSAFAIKDLRTGALTPLGSQPSGGTNPVHLEVHRDGRWLVVANYLGATAALLPIQADGALGPPSDVVPLSGPPGPDPAEQSGPHPHHIPFDPSGNFIALPDKGLDRVFVFRVDTHAGRLQPANPPWTATRRGAGPRHIAFHPNRPFAYVINELDSTVAAYAYTEGVLSLLQVLPSAPEDAPPKNTGAEILVHPSGQTVYVSNRGHDSVGVFAIQDGGRELSAVGWHSSGGRVPRAMALDPTGRFLYAANQSSDSIVTFAVDSSTGDLAPTGQTVEVGSPSTIVFVAR
jgi:6-phosphogluconolactonase